MNSGRGDEMSYAEDMLLKLAGMENGKGGEQPPSIPAGAQQPQETTRDERMLINSMRDPTLFRSLAASVLVDTPRQYADKWKYEQDIQEGVDSGDFGDPGQVRYLQYHGYSLNDIAKMSPETRARELKAITGGDLVAQLNPQAQTDFSRFEGMKDQGVLPRQVHEKFLGGKDALIGGFFERLADTAEVNLAQADPRGTLSSLAHGVVRSVPNMFLRRLPEIAARAALGDGAAVGTALLSGISEAGTEGGATYREAKKRMGRKDALLAAMDTEGKNKLLLGISNTAQAILANRYMPKVMDAFAKKGKESVGKVFDIILDAAIQGGEEMGQGAITSTSLGDPINMADLAFEGVVGAVSTLATAGLGAGYAKTFDGYARRRMAGEAKEYWDPKIQKLVDNGRAGGKTYSRNDAMMDLGLSPESFSHKNIFNKDIPATQHAYIRMLVDQEVAKLASTGEIDGAKAEGELRRIKASNELANASDQGNAKINTDNAAPSPVKKTYDPITQDDFNDPNAPQVLIFMNKVFDRKTLNNIDEETRKKITLMAKDRFFNYRAEKQLPTGDRDIPVRKSLEAFYGTVYDTIPEAQRRVDRETFINRNISVSNWVEANNAMQIAISKKAQQNREDKIKELQRTGSDPAELARLIAENEEVEARKKDFNSPNFTEPENPLAPTGQQLAQYEQNTDENSHTSAMVENEKLRKVIGGNDLLTEDSDAVEVAESLLGLEDGLLATLLRDPQILFEDEYSGTEYDREQYNRKMSALTKSIDSLNEVADRLQNESISPEGIQAVMDMIRDRVKGIAAMTDKPWDNRKVKYSGDEFKKLATRIGERFGIPETVTRMVTEALDNAHRAAFGVKKFANDKIYDATHNGLIRKGSEVNTETGRILLSIKYFDNIINSDSASEQKKVRAEFAKEVMYRKLFDLNDSGDMVEFIMKEMFIPKKTLEDGNFPKGISESAIDKVIEHFRSKGKDKAHVVAKLEEMKAADMLRQDQDKMARLLAEDEAEAAAMTELTDEVFNNLVEEAESYANLDERRRIPVTAERAVQFLDEISSIYASLARKGKAQEFLLKLENRLKYWKKQSGKSNHANGTKAKDMYDLYRGLNLNSFVNLADSNGDIIFNVEKFHEAFPLTELGQISRDIAKIRAFENHKAAIDEEKSNSAVAPVFDPTNPIANQAGVDVHATEDVFGPAVEVPPAPAAEPSASDVSPAPDSNATFDSFPLGAVAGQEIQKEPSSARTGWTGKILSVFHKGDAKNPAAFNTYWGRMQKFVSGKESILSKSIEAIRDASLKSPEIKAQVDNIFNYSLDRNVSLDGVDPSVRQHVENVLNSLKEVMRLRKEAGLKGGPKRSSDITRGIIHDMRDNPNFVPDPEALKDFALGTMRDGTVSSFEEGLALAHKVLSRQAWGDMKLNTMPKYAQELLGYNPDPMVQLYLNSRKLVRDTARQIFERDLLADTKVVADTQLEPDYVQLVSDKNSNERYYSLEGKWVPPEVAAMLHQESKARSEIVKSYLMLHSMFKQMKIIYSTTSYVNNFFGNFFLMQMGGIPLHHSIKAYPKAVKEVYSWLHDGKISPRLKEAIDAGLFEGTMTLSELSLSDNDMDAMSKLKDDDLQGINRILFKGLNKLENNKIGKFGRTMYEGIEQVHRYVSYQYFRDVGHTTDLASGSLDPTKPFASFVKNLNPMRKKTAMDPAHAVAQVDKTLFNYRDLPSGVKFLRDTGIPFISFPYLAGKSFLRNTVENPTGIIAMVLTGTLLREAVRGASGGEKELELEGWIPYWELIDPLQRSNNRYGESMLDAVLGNFTPGGPLVIPYELMTGEKMFGGFPIAEKRGKEPTAGDMGRHVADVMMPAAFSSAIRNVEKYSQGKDSGANLLFRQFGVRLRDSDTGRLRKDLSALKFRARDKVRDFKSGKISESELRDSLIRIKQSENNLREQYGEVLGVGPYSK